MAEAEGREGRNIREGRNEREGREADRSLPSSSEVTSISVRSDMSANVRSDMSANVRSDMSANLRSDMSATGAPRQPVVEKTSVKVRSGG